MMVHNSTHISYHVIDWTRAHLHIVIIMSADTDCLAVTIAGISTLFNVHLLSTDESHYIIVLFDLGHLYTSSSFKFGIR